MYGLPCRLPGCNCSDITVPTGTVIEEMLEALYYTIVDFNDYPESLQATLGGLLHLPDSTADYFYAIQTYNGIDFYATEEEFKQHYERDWPDVYWGSLDNKMLAEWIKRLELA